MTRPVRCQRLVRAFPSRFPSRLDLTSSRNRRRTRSRRTSGPLRIRDRQSFHLKTQRRQTGNLSVQSPRDTRSNDGCSTLELLELTLEVPTQTSRSDAGAEVVGHLKDRDLHPIGTQLWEPRCARGSSSSGRTMPTK
jgi:hypothetical protein